MSAVLGSAWLSSRPTPRFSYSTWLFLRVLALIQAIAFASAWSQLPGLVGPQGILPAQPFFDAVLRELGPTSAHAQLPSLCWIIGAGPTALSALCVIGIALSTLVFVGIAPAPALLGIWACYLSLSGAGQVFFNFQWDALLLETTLLAVALAPWSLLPLWRPGLHEPPFVARLLLVWLLFRLMVLSGAAKLLSGDLTWRELSALTFHYETQPLPTPLAYWVHQVPAWFHRATCAGMFTIELLVPFFFFAPRPLRHRAAFLTIALMLLIALTGNYTYFNFLTAALCLLCLDDTILARFFPFLKNVPPAPALSRWRRWPVYALAVFVFTYTTLQLIPSLFRGTKLPPAFDAVAADLAPYRSLNSYGLFAVMTNPRPELIIEGSDDARTWLAYEFPHKPGALTRSLTWVAPHQPRLDWQLWFAALTPPAHNRWMMSLAEHLLRGTPDVLSLLAHNPFPAKPPRHLRIVRYEYHFTDPATRSRTGEVWRRTPLDFYLAPASLK